MAKLFIVPEDTVIPELESVIEACDPAGDYVPSSDTMGLLKAVLEHGAAVGDVWIHENNFEDCGPLPRKIVELALFGDAFLQSWCFDDITIALFHDDGTVFVRRC